MHAFMTQHQQAYTKGKNATDMFLVIEAMDILHSDNVDGFCLISSDSDFTGFAKRLREENMLVLGIGKKTTPESFRNACGIFVFEEILSLSSQVDTAEEDKDDSSIDWKRLVSKAIEVATREDEWAGLADVCNSIKKLDPSFDTRTYGNRTLLALIRTAPDAFEVRGRQTCQWRATGVSCASASLGANDLDVSTAKS